MSKRQIKPYKGGRTQRVYARLTPDEKKALRAELKRQKMSLSDWIVYCLNNLEGGK